MSEHSTLPWHFYEIADNAHDGLGYLIAQDDGDIAHHGEPTRSAAENRANAALIVRAVNAHDALVEYVRSSASAGCATAEHLLKLHDLKETK